MKRSSCLPAVLLGLTVTSAFVASTASAAPEGTRPAGVRVAQARVGNVVVAQQDPQPEEQTNPPTPPPTTAPTVGDGTSETQPAVSLGTTTTAPPTADQPQASADEGKPKPKPRAWAGTQIFVQTSMTTATVFKGQTQYNDPTVDSSAYILPRYAFNKDWQLRGRFIVNYEYTNSDTTTRRNETTISDTTVQLWYKGLPEFGGPAKIKAMLAANLSLPTSKLSRARTMVASPGASLQLVKAIEHIPGDGEIDLIGGLTYTHPLYRYTTPETLDPTPYAFSCFGGNACQDQLSGTFNPSDSLSYSLIAVGTWGKWSPALFFLGASQWAYQGNKDLSYQGRPVASPTDVGAQAPNGVRQSSYFSAWLDYEANAWLTAEVGYWLSRSVLTEGGKYGNPFWDRYNDMRVYLGANFNIDNIMKTLEGQGGEAGVVRAQNKKRPMFAF